MHLLKWQYQPQRRGTSWRSSIYNGRDQIEELLEENPSLRAQLGVIVEKSYPNARRLAANETGLPLSTFPDVCPFTVEQITGDWWPD